MYDKATALMFLSIPLILGDVLSLALLLPYPALLSKRIKVEETMLERELDSYAEYKRKVKYKMIPFIW